MRIIAHIRVKLCNDVVNVLKQSLEPEMEEFAAQRYDSKCTVEKGSINIEFKLADLTALRIALNSYLRYLTTCYNTLQIVQDKDKEPRQL